MKREEIQKLNGILDQIKEFEFMCEDINERSYNSWWKIKTPNREISLHYEDTRLRFKNFIESEIEILKKEISLED